jgi:hypothetical protein
MAVLRNGQKVIDPQHIMGAAHRESGTRCSACFYPLILCPVVDDFGTIPRLLLELSLEPFHHTTLLGQSGLLPSHCAAVHVCSSVTRALSLLPMILFSRNFSGRPLTVTSQQPQI